MTHTTETLMALANKYAALSYACSSHDLSEDHPHTLKARAALQAALVDVMRDVEKYQELIYAVGQKYPDETRHQTALRYIKRMEEPATMLHRAGECKTLYRVNA